MTPKKDVKLKLIDTLGSVTAGKIYVEIERARLTHTLAKIREEEGDITTAASVLQVLQVETFGSMDRKEKVELILEQMRLCLAKKDYIRTQIISKKDYIRTQIISKKDYIRTQIISKKDYIRTQIISKKDYIRTQIISKKDYIPTQIISKKVSTEFFKESDAVDLKLKFYKLMIELDQHESSYLAIFKHCLAIYNI